jgi:hypothetical protein
MSMYKHSVDIICIENDLECSAVRSALEWWGIQVNMFYIGQAQHIVDLLNGKEKRAKHILIGAHGDQEGICLPELGGDIAKKQPYDKKLSANNLKEFLKLDGSIVLSNGCATGTQEIADAFLSSGAKYYIAAKDYPFGDASLFYVLSFYYHLFVNNLTAEQSHEKAKNQDEKTKVFELFQG